MIVIDLFSGCGGFSLGMEKAGYQIAVAYDNWKPAIDVYRKNFKHPIKEIDLRTISEEEIEFLKTLNPDIIIGGPPCQDFSSAGKRNESGERAILTLDFANIIKKIMPKYFIMENVHNIQKFETLQKVKNIFIEQNYGLTEVVLNSSYFGVPQSRKRYFLVGELNGKDNSLKNFLEKKNSEKPMTIREYLGNSLELEHYYRHPRSYERRGIFSIDEPSPTIRGVNRPLPPNYKIHSGDTTNILENVRALTTIERSYLQTFPKSFIFEGTKGNLEQMIGNAVPVNLAKHVGLALKEYIKSKTIK